MGIARIYEGVDHNELVNDFSPIGWGAPRVMDEIGRYIVEHSGSVSPVPQTSNPVSAVASQ